MEDKRKFSRILFDTKAKLHNDQGEWQTRLHDLCLNGAMVEEPSGMHTDKPMELGFTLPGSDIELRMTADVVYQRDGYLGLKCAFIDVDSITHLRRLLELNTGDSSLLNRELKQFITEHDQAQ
ncbi:pilus assembly protein [Shewanella mangrovi]|uniref:Cyclic diguanosine monophosphate-binding protein n=1 Tax=Shewanella mangrovi TaxID=1515746 RepID=A0A094JGY8_9GAMM|nr:PilZ domain-containing protein [Shewanella mangrovi]KFZ39230.1 pilus assembly protein [Shewanella mangrovi]